MTRAELIQFINANIYPNGRNQITAPMVRDSILAVVGFLGDAAVKDIGAVLENNTDLVTGGAVYDAIRAYLSSVMKMVGETTTDVITNPTANPVYVDGEPHTAQKGDVVVYGYKEFWWTGSMWKELGDEASWALKTISITGTGDLTGGGTLEANRTLDLTQSAKDKLAHGETAFSWLESYSTNRLRLKSPYSYLNARKGLILEEETDYTNTPADFVKQVVTVGETEYTILRSKLPIVSDSFISAGGISPGGGASGTTLQAVWDSLTTNTGDYANAKIHSGHIPLGSGLGVDGSGNIYVTSQGTVTGIKIGSTTYTPSAGSTIVDISSGIPTSMAWSAITSTPTTLAGYGITDAKIESGVITLGSSTITPLTSHQTIYNLVINNSAGTAQITYKPNVSGTYSLTLTSAMVGLGNVENTALSTWAGTSNITTLGTISTGVWQGTAIGYNYVAAHYIGRTRTTASAAQATLLGIDAISNASSSGSSDASRIVWDSTNNAWHFLGGIYADSFISAGGLSSGGGTSGIDLAAMWASLQNNDNVTTYDSYKIHTNHLPTIAGTGITGTYSTSGTAPNLTTSLSLSVDVATILGYTPVAPSALADYLPKAGGNMTGPLGIYSQGNESWNVSTAESKIRYFYNKLTIPDGSPGSYMSGVSFMTGYTGFQLATYGGVNDNRLYFRQIGDSSPYYNNWYQIYHTGNANLFSVDWKYNTGRCVEQRIYGDSGEAAYDYYYTAIKTVYEQQSPSYRNGAMVFYTMHDSYQAGSETEKMRLSSAGNLNIGYAGDMGYKLYVNGTSRFSDSISLNGYCTLSAGYGVLQVTNTNGSAWFGPMNDAYCHIYTDIAGGFYFDKSNLYANGYTIYHSGNLSPLTTTNYSSYALPLTGGTISGSIIIGDSTTISSGSDAKLILDNTDNETYYQYIRFAQNGTMYGYLGTLGSTILSWNGYTIYHSGNVNSTSVDWSASSLTLAGYITGLKGVIGGVSSRPSLGYFTGVPALVSFGEDANKFGLFGWVESSGKTFLQSGEGRNGSSTSYDLNLQVLGGNVGIGTDSPSSKLDVNGGLSATNLSLASITDTWNFNAYDRKVRFLHCAATPATGAPGGYYGGVSIISGYVGFQLVTYGGGTENLLFRKVDDGDNWTSWRDIWHSGNSNTSSVAWKSSVDKTGELRIHGNSSYIDGNWYYTAIKTIYEQASPSYRNGAMVFYTMNNSYQEGTETEKMRLSSAGNLNIGYAGDAGYKLYAAGTIASSGDQVITSDATKKTNLVPITLTAEQIANAPAISFDWKDGSGHSFGSIAQYWKPICPEMVLGEEGDYSLAYAQGAFTNGIIIAREVKSLKDKLVPLFEKYEPIFNKVNTHEDRINDLTNKLQAANDEIFHLKQELTQLKMSRSYGME